MTPKAITPHTGKRKRNSRSVASAGDDEELDHLSPDHDKGFPLVEKSRRVAASISPIREEPDDAPEDAPDELSLLQDTAGSVRKTSRSESVLEVATPASVVPSSRSTPKSTQGKTPIAGRIGNMPLSLRQSIVRRSRSTELQVTPTTLTNGRPRLSAASRSDASPQTPGANPEDEDSEDELTPRPGEETPRSVVAVLPVEPTAGDDGELDELSPAQPALTPQPPSQRTDKQSKQNPVDSPEVQQEATPTRRRGRPKKVVTEEEIEVQATPATNESGRQKSNLSKETRAYPDDIPDELSPDAANRTQQAPIRTAPDQIRPAKKQAPEPTVDVSSSEDSDDYDPKVHEEEEDDRVQSTTRRALESKPAKKSSHEPPRKRQKTSGPKYAISVMRIQGSLVRGISVADTTHTLVENNIDHRIARLAGKMQSLQEDPARRKLMRTEINLALAFKESLSEKLLDLQDANDTLTSSFKKRKILRAGNLQRRREFIAIQNSRQEVALETDDKQASFNAAKEKVESKSKLSANLFEIQAAVQSGRDLARKKGRDSEGAEMPLEMWLDSVGRQVGSVGGGLLSSVKDFNRGLERAAGWLEGRA